MGVVGFRLEPERVESVADMVRLMRGMAASRELGLHRVTGEVAVRQVAAVFERALPLDRARVYPEFTLGMTPVDRVLGLLGSVRAEPTWPTMAVGWEAACDRLARVIWSARSVIDGGGDG